MTEEITCPVPGCGKDWSEYLNSDDCEATFMEKDDDGRVIFHHHVTCSCKARLDISHIYDEGWFVKILQKES